MLFAAIAFSNCNQIIAEPNYSDEVNIAKIEFASSGCFHNEEYILRLVKRNNVLFADLKSEDGKQETTQLTDKQFEVFKEFFRELKKLKKRFGCTTIESYTVNYQDEVIKKTDEGCNWWGFQKLRKSLFQY